VQILVLGAGGFIGSHLVEHLVDRAEHQIVGLDLTREKLSGSLNHGFQFHEADVRAMPQLVDDLIRKADLCVDLIAYANPSIYVTSPLEVFNLNFVQNLRVAEMCIRHGTRLVQYSSAEVYGKTTEGGAYNEETSDVIFGPVNKQRWIYATAKLLLDRVLYAHGMAGNLEYTIVRPFNFIGPRIDYLVPPGSMGGPRVFAHFMSALLGQGPMYLVDGGNVHRAFLHIEDATRAFQTILDRPDDTRNQIYNVGNPDNNVTIRELAQLMAGLYEEITGAPPQSPLVDVKGEEFYGAGYEDSDRLPPDISKICGLGWTPRHDLEKTLRDAMSYYLEPGCEERRQVSLEPPLSQQVFLESPLPRPVEAGLVI
jgi:UDP-apiose/xylose synthase